MNFLFKNEYSYLDSIFMSVAAIGFSQGYIAIPIAITAIGLAIHCTIGRKYNAPSA